MTNAIFGSGFRSENFPIVKSCAISVPAIFFFYNQRNEENEIVLREMKQKIYYHFQSK